jgi:hypothetical protein
VLHRCNHSTDTLVFFPSEFAVQLVVFDKSTVNARRNSDKMMGKGKRGRKEVKREK